MEAHLIALLIATAAVLLLVIFRGLFLRGYGRSMKRLEETDPKGFKKSLIQIEGLTRKSDRKLDELDLHLTALKPEFLSTETWVAAQRVKGFMWRYMVRLTWFLLILVAIHFLSYSEMVQRLISLPDAFFNSYMLDFLSDTFSMKRAYLPFHRFRRMDPLRHNSRPDFKPLSVSTHRRARHHCRWPDVVRRRWSRRPRRHDLR